MKKLSTNWRLYKSRKLLDFSTTLNGLFETFPPATLGYQFQFDQWSSHYKLYRIGIQKGATASKKSREEWDQIRDDEMEALFFCIDAAASSRDPKVNAVGIPLQELYQGVHHNMTGVSMGEQTGYMIEFFDNVEKGGYLKLIQKIPGGDFYYPRAKKAHEDFLAATVEKTKFEQEQKEILSASEVRKDLTIATNKLFTKLLILEEESVSTHTPAQQEQLSKLIKEINTLIENTERDIATRKSDDEEEEEKKKDKD